MHIASTGKMGSFFILTFKGFVEYLAATQFPFILLSYMMVGDFDLS